MRLLLFLAVTLGASAPVRADVSAPAPAAIRWRSDAPAAEREAAKAQRPLLVFFTADWCLACKEMLVKSFAEPTVTELVARRFVALLVDVTADDAPGIGLRDRLHIRALPTLVVRRGNEDRLRHEGFLGAAELSAALERVR
jgi:thiol:disulfide interchange protein DsbD